MGGICHYHAGEWPCTEGRSRYSDKSALFTGSREIAHLEAPGVIDLRITRTGWARAKEDYGRDTAVRGGIDTDSAAWRFRGNAA